MKIKIHNARPDLSFSLWFSQKKTASAIDQKWVLGWLWIDLLWCMCVVAVMGCGGNTSNPIDSLKARETSKLEEEQDQHFQLWQQNQWFLWTEKQFIRLEFYLP